MKSAELEEKARREREELEKSLSELNQNLSPGQLLDDFYFHGEGFTGYIRRLQEDPVPGALVGAAIAWSAGREEIKGAVSGAGSKAASAGRDKLSRAGHRVADTGASARDKVSAAGDSARTTASHARERAGEKAGQAVERGRQAVREGNTAMREHPLMAVAVGFSLGAALGGLTPITAREHEAMDSAAEKFKGEKSQASSTGQHRIT